MYESCKTESRRRVDSVLGTGFLKLEFSYIKNHFSASCGSEGYVNNYFINVKLQLFSSVPSFRSKFDCSGMEICILLCHREGRLKHSY